MLHLPPPPSDGPTRRRSKSQSKLRLGIKRSSIPKTTPTSGPPPPPPPPQSPLPSPRKRSHRKKEGFNRSASKKSNNSSKAKAKAKSWIIKQRGSHVDDESKANKNFIVSARLQSGGDSSTMERKKKKSSKLHSNSIVEARRKAAMAIYESNDLVIESDLEPVVVQSSPLKYKNAIEVETEKSSKRNNSQRRSDSMIQKPKLTFRNKKSNSSDEERRTINGSMSINDTVSFDSMHSSKSKGLSIDTGADNRKKGFFRNTVRKISTSLPSPNRRKKDERSTEKSSRNRNNRYRGATSKNKPISTHNFNHRNKNLFEDPPLDDSLFFEDTNLQSEETTDGFEPLKNESEFSSLFIEPLKEDRLKGCEPTGMYYLERIDPFFVENKVDEKVINASDDGKSLSSKLEKTLDMQNEKKRGCVTNKSDLKTTKLEELNEEEATAFALEKSKIDPEETIRGYSKETELGTTSFDSDGFDNVFTPDNKTSKGAKEDLPESLTQEDVLTRESLHPEDVAAKIFGIKFTNDDSSFVDLTRETSRASLLKSFNIDQEKKRMGEILLSNKESKIDIPENSKTHTSDSAETIEEDLTDSSKKLESWLQGNNKNAMPKSTFKPKQFNTSSVPKKKKYGPLTDTNGKHMKDIHVKNTEVQKLLPNHISEPTKIPKDYYDLNRVNTIETMPLSVTSSFSRSSSSKHSHDSPISHQEIRDDLSEEMQELSRNIKVSKMKDIGHKSDPPITKNEPINSNLEFKRLSEDEILSSKVIGTPEKGNHDTPSPMITIKSAKLSTAVRKQNEDDSSHSAAKRNQGQDRFADKQDSKLSSKVTPHQPEFTDQRIHDDNVLNRYSNTYFELDDGYIPLSSKNDKCNNYTNPLTSNKIRNNLEFQASVYQVKSSTEHLDRQTKNEEKIATVNPTSQTKVSRMSISPSLHSRRKETIVKLRKYRESVDRKSRESPIRIVQIEDQSLDSTKVSSLGLNSTKSNAYRRALKHLKKNDLKRSRSTSASRRNQVDPSRSRSVPRPRSELCSSTNPEIRGGEEFKNNLLQVVFPDNRALPQQVEKHSGMIKRLPRLPNVSPKKHQEKRSPALPIWFGKPSRAAKEGKILIKKESDTKKKRSVPTNKRSKRKVRMIFPRNDTNLSQEQCIISKATIQGYIKIRKKLIEPHIVAIGLSAIQRKRKALIKMGYTTVRARSIRRRKKSIMQRAKKIVIQIDESKMDPIERAGFRILSKSAVIIQARFRQYIALKNAIERMWAIIEIQSYFRRWRCEVYLYAHSWSAIKIQSMYRGWQIRDSLNIMQVCAVDIQRIVRGYLASIRIYEDIFKILYLQSMFRCWLARNESVKRLRKLIFLQATCRSFIVRLKIQNLAKAATHVQTIYRGYSVKMKCKTLKKENESAITIQKIWRGYLHYSEFVFVIADTIILQRNARIWIAKRSVQRRKQHINASKIQACWRKHKTQIHSGIKMADIVLIQSIARRWLAINQARTVMIEDWSANRLQSWWKLLLCMKQKKSNFSASKIQATWRGFWQAKQYLSMKNKAIRIQSAFRCQQAKIQRDSKLGFAVRIQSVIRRWLALKIAATLRTRSVYFASQSHLHREDIAAKCIQLRWLNLRARRKEDAAATIIQRFFIMVKAEVDKVVREEERRLAKQRMRRRRRKDSEDEDKLLEIAWLSTMGTESFGERDDGSTLITSYQPDIVQYQPSEDISEITTPTIFLRSSPPRISTLSQEDLNQDLSLEETWIDIGVRRNKQKVHEMRLARNSHDEKCLSYHNYPKSDQATLTDNDSRSIGYQNYNSSSDVSIRSTHLKKQRQSSQLDSSRSLPPIDGTLVHTLYHQTSNPSQNSYHTALPSHRYFEVNGISLPDYDVNRISLPPKIHESKEAYDNASLNFPNHKEINYHQRLKTQTRRIRVNTDIHEKCKFQIPHRQEAQFNRRSRSQPRRRCINKETNRAEFPTHQEKNHRKNSQSQPRILLPIEDTHCVSRGGMPPRQDMHRARSRSQPRTCRVQRVSAQNEKYHDEDIGDRYSSLQQYPVHMDNYYDERQVAQFDGIYKDYEAHGCENNYNGLGYPQSPRHGYKYSAR